MTGPILLTGGTGTLGRLTLPRLLAAGSEVRVLSRGGGAGSAAARPGPSHVAADLRDDDLGPALEGVETVVHLAGSASGDEQTTARLVRAARAAGVTHLISMSVVGADRLPVRTRTDRMMFGYFAAKRAAEDVVADSGLNWSVLRATQFHEAILKMISTLSRSPIVPTFAGVRFQPIAASEVADRLVELTRIGPSGLVPELAGPRIHPMTELVRGYLSRRGRRRLVVALPLAGPAARAYREGANLSPDRAVGRLTWDDFLAQEAAAELTRSRPR